MKPPIEARLLEIYIICHTKVVADTTSLFTKYTQTMCFVHHHSGVVLLFQCNDFREFGKVTFHGEEAIDDNQFQGLSIASHELMLEVFHVVVFVMEELGKRETTPIHNGCVVAVITNNVVVSACQT